MLYQVAMAAALGVVAPYLLARRGRHYWETLPGRLGRSPETGSGSALAGALWLHAVSVGEVGVAATLARALPASLPLLITTVTPTGQRQARAAFLGHARPARVAYLPFDLSFAVERFFARFAPRALILVEGDYWPLLLRRAQIRKLPIAVINGRVSPRSFARLERIYRCCPALIRALFSPVDRFGVQTLADQQRLLALGVQPERVQVTGNLKYDTPEPAFKPELAAKLTAFAAGRPILVAGSTMPGEEEQVLDAFAQLGGGGRALLVLAPRHPERFDGVARLLARRGLRFLRRSALKSVHEVPAVSPDDWPAVVLLDSLGELAGIYRLATVAFIGGTLVPTGGHNPLEPARFSVPIIVGPAMDNFRQVAEAFDEARAWQRAANSSALAQGWDHFLRHPEQAVATGQRAAQLVKSGQGAVERTLELLTPLLQLP